MKKTPYPGWWDGRLLGYAELTGCLSVRKFLHSVFRTNCRRGKAEFIKATAFRTRAAEV